MEEGQNTSTHPPAAGKALLRNRQLPLQVFPPQKKRFQGGEQNESVGMQNKKQQSGLTMLASTKYLVWYFNLPVGFRKITVEFFMYIPHSSNFHCHFPEYS